MRVIVPAVAFSSAISGVQRHALNLLHCLLKLPQVETVGVVIAPWQREMLACAGLLESDRLRVHIAEMTSSSFTRNRWYYRELPKLVSRVGASLVHFSYPVPVNAPALRCATVLTLHDLYPFEIPHNFGFPKVLLNQFILKQSLRSVSAIACVSEATRMTLRRLFPAAAAKAITIPNCIEPGLACALHSPLPDWRGEPFLLCVAQHRRNKNIPVAIRAFWRLLRSGKLSQHTRLVVIGIDGPETAHLNQLTKDLGLAASVLFLRGLTDAELQWFYARCEVLLAPSLTEGFGLPVAEAQLAGSRVVCSDIPSFREIGGHACVYVPLDGRADLQFALAIEKALQEPAPLPAALPQFSSATLASHYAALYKGLLAPSGCFVRSPSMTSPPLALGGRQIL